MGYTNTHFGCTATTMVLTTIFQLTTFLVLLPSLGQRVSEERGENDTNNKTSQLRSARLRLKFSAECDSINCILIIAVGAKAGCRIDKQGVTLRKAKKKKVILMTQSTLGRIRPVCQYAVHRVKLCAEFQPQSRTFEMFYCRCHYPLPPHLLSDLMTATTPKMSSVKK